MVEFLVKHKLINTSQHGFLKARSCLTNLLCFLEEITKWVDDGSPVDVVYLDFQKAFDKVPHQRLLLKLKAHGIGNDVINWIEKWLTHRRQRVIVDGEISNWKSALSGVPQGSVLGPIHGNMDEGYKMGDAVLGRTTQEKDLGVTFSADMKLSEQCGIAASKGNQILGLIRRTITYKEKHLIVPLYKAIVRPHLEYCIQAWRPYRKKDIDKLERIQRRATKMIPELRDLSYESRLLQCGLTTLETRRLRGNQIEVFKIVNGYEDVNRNMFFKLKEGSRTRGHKAALVKEQCRLDMRKYSFSQRVINEWNKLPNDCVNASSVNMFKNRIDRHLIRAGYT